MKRIWLKIRLFFSRKKKEDHNKGKIYPLW